MLDPKVVWRLNFQKQIGKSDAMVYKVDFCKADMINIDISYPYSNRSL